MKYSVQVKVMVGCLTQKPAEWLSCSDFSWSMTSPWIPTAWITNVQVVIKLDTIGGNGEISRSSHQRPDKGGHLKGILLEQQNKAVIWIKCKQQVDSIICDFEHDLEIITWKMMNCINLNNISGFLNQNKSSRGFTWAPADGPVCPISRAKDETMCWSFVPTSITSFCNRNRVVKTISVSWNCHGHLREIDGVTYNCWDEWKPEVDIQAWKVKTFVNSKSGIGFFIIFSHLINH